MTRQRPNVIRTVDSRLEPAGGFVVTLHPDGVHLRPKRARADAATIFLTWDQVYYRGHQLRAAGKRAAKINKAVGTLMRKATKKRKWAGE